MFGEVELIDDMQVKAADFNPNARVRVRCRACGEEFSREICRLDRLHQCLDAATPWHGRRHHHQTHNVRLEYMLLDELAKIPVRSRVTDAGYDIFSIEAAVVPPHGTALVRTGLALAAPPGYYYTIDSRSGLARSYRITPYRATIDGGYIDSLDVILVNDSDRPYHVQVGDRVAQIVLHELIEGDLVGVKEFSPAYRVRGTAGFGSSGR